MTAITIRPTLYQIKNWDAIYENAKSRTIKNKSWCSIPNKQDGLGYCRLISEGADIYGAFVAVALIASRQSIPRDGYLTDTGGSQGIPLTPDDLALQTRIPVDIIVRMLNVCSSKSIRWILQVPDGDTTGECQEPVTPPMNRIEENRIEESVSRESGERAQYALKHKGYEIILKEPILASITPLQWVSYIQAYPNVDEVKAAEQAAIKAIDFKNGLDNPSAFMRKQFQILAEPKKKAYGEDKYSHLKG